MTARGPNLRDSTDVTASKRIHREYKLTRLHPQGKGGPKDLLCRNHSNFPGNVSARHNYSG